MTIPRTSQTTGYSSISKSRVLGNGNCAFNAFALAMRAQDFLQEIEDFYANEEKDINAELKIFLDEFKTKFKKVCPPSSPPLSDWDYFKLVMLSPISDDDIQIKLAPILRKLAIDEASNDASHYARTEQPLLAAFHSYVEPSESPSSADDIFSRIDFIKAKFAKLAEKYVKGEENKNQEITNQLQTWWKLEGYNQFLEKLRNPGVWVGDLELFQLAKYFKINLYARHDASLHGILVNQGTVDKSEKTSPELIRILVDRQIISQPSDEDKEIIFLIRDEAELKTRLDSLNENDVGAVLDEEITAISPEGVGELCARGVLIQDSKNNKFNLIASQEVVGDRIVAVGEQDQALILELYNNRAGKNPTSMTLKNDHFHWEPVMRETGVMPRTKAVAEAATPSETAVTKPATKTAVVEPDLDANVVQVLPEQTISQAIAAKPSTTINDENVNLQNVIGLLDDCAHALEKLIKAMEALEKYYLQQEKIQQEKEAKLKTCNAQSAPTSSSAPSSQSAPASQSASTSSSVATNGFFANSRAQQNEGPNFKPRNTVDSLKINDTIRGG